MSEAPKMGVLGSKEEDKKSVEMGKDDSPERYVPYSVDKNSETYDTEALSIMDINDIIGVQTEPVGDSTLEGEMAALSAMITEGKVGEDEELEGRSGVDGAHGEIVAREDDGKNALKDEGDGEEAEERDGDSQASREQDEPKKSNSQKEESSINKSLQLIGEAYISDDSQEISEEEISKPPKVVFSCKPLVDRLSIELQEDPTDLWDSSLVPDETEGEILKPVTTTSEVTKEPAKTLHENLDSPIIVAEAESLQVLADDPLEKILEGPSGESSSLDTPPTPPEIEKSEGAVEPSADEIPPPENAIESAVELEASESNLKTSSLDEATVENNQAEESEVPVEAPQVLETSTEEIPLVEEMETDSPQGTPETEQIKIEPEPMEITEETSGELAGEDEPDKSEDLVNQLLEKMSSPPEKLIDNKPLEKEKTPDVEIAIEIPAIETEEMEVEEETGTSEPALAQPLEEEVTRINEEKGEIQEALVPSLSIQEKDNEEELISSACEQREEIEEEELVLSASKQDEPIEEELILSAPEKEVIEEKLIPSIPEEKDELILSIPKGNEELIPTLTSEKEELIVSVTEANEELIPALSNEKEEFIPSAEEQEDPPHKESLNSSGILKEADDSSPTPISPIVIEEEKHELVEESPAVEEDKYTKNIPNESDPPIEKQQEESKTLEEKSTPEVSEAREISEVQEKILNPDDFKNSEVLKEKPDANSQEIDEKMPEPVEDTTSPQKTTDGISEATESISEAPKSPIEASEEIETKESPSSQEMEKTDPLDKKTDSLPRSPPEAVSSRQTVPTSSPESPEAEKNEELELSMSIPEPEVQEDLEEVIEGFPEEIPEKIDEENLANQLSKTPEPAGNLEQELMSLDSSPKHVETSFNLDPQQKLDIPDELLADLPGEVDPSVSNPEISELECAVKFLQESEEQIESPLVLSPKLEDNVEDLAEADQSFPADDDPGVLDAELDEIITDPIAISEAEIISEAAKLESEKKMKEEAEISLKSTLPIEEKIEKEEVKPVDKVSEKLEVEPKPVEPQLHKSTVKLPMISILEERLREPPKIEIPVAEHRINEPPTTRKTSLLMQQDQKVNYHKMDSPKSREESKLVETPRKDHDKHEIENIGSPRIILKIAKSAIADCAEPRSPKSPKIRSAANSPNPEDSPGQKLGKIRMKLSRSGHPSIIPNESTDEVPRPESSLAGSSLSPLGMKIKLSKTGDASIVQPEKFDPPEDKRLESPLGMKIKMLTKPETSLEDKRTDSPLGMKIKLSKTGEAPSIVPQDFKDLQKHKIGKSSEVSCSPVEDKRLDCSQTTKLKVLSKSEIAPDEKRTDSPIGMKIKLSKSGEAPLILPQDFKDLQKHKIDMQQSPKRTDSPLGMKIKLSRTGDASIIQQTEKVEDELREIFPEAPRRTESPLGVKIKLLKSGDASIVPSDHEDESKRTDSPLGMKIKISKKSGTLIREPSAADSFKDKLEIPDLPPRRTESPLGMKIKLSKSGDASIIHSEVIEESNQEKTKPEIPQVSPTPEATSSIGMKIKLSKTGDATIIHPEREDEGKGKEWADSSIGMKIKLSRSGDVSIIQSSGENEGKLRQKSPDLAGIESMKIKLSKTGHHTIVSGDPDPHKSRDPDVSEMIIEPITTTPLEHESLKRAGPVMTPVEVKKYKMETKLSHILPDVTIQPVIPKEHKPQGTATISRQQMNVINREISITQVRSLAEGFKQVIENESEDVQIIEPHPELIIVNENSNSSQDVMIIDEVPALRVPEVKVPKKRGRPRRIGLPVVEVIPQDPLALDNPVARTAEPKENERPKRTCSRQKSYAPPKRGRGRGRGKRKLDRTEYLGAKKPKIEQNLTIIENRTTALISLDEEGGLENHSELYKVLSHAPKRTGEGEVEAEGLEVDALEMDVEAPLDELRDKRKMDEGKEGKETFGAPDRQNWLTPSSRKILEGRSDISTVQVIDEETRMSAESFSRSQTPARSISAQAGEPIINEESQGSVLSTATTESEKVKVRNRRMEINFDPDEGPFTVEKIAEYEWPTDRKGDTFMIQEQISQYLGVKSFKRKYPDLKRRMVDMEERNHLRENGLVSESMCDMGLTAVCSSEVLDIMCSDFPDQYEEYRKHMREKQIKEHSKKQKELTAAANAEKNRIDLAEMAVQSALTWNVGLNKARKESRKCSLDLQTFTIHVPKKQQKVEDNTSVSHYPVALIPGQYTDYYREYTPAELRYYPLNTVLYGPMRPNERKFDSQSEGSQSDSDSDSSSDDSSSSSSDGTQDTEGSQSTMDDVDVELANQKDKSIKCKMCLKNLNKFGKPEVQIQCGTCNGYVHPSCIDLTLDMVPHIQAYAWQCTDCKTCAQCHDPADEDKMLFCDMCDRGYHIYCVGLRRVPQGRWHCQECAMCASCGSREPGGIVCADRNSVAQWQHEYKKGDKNTRVYVSTLCVPCSKLWRKGRYCPHCSRCHTAPRLDLEENLVHCSACDKYLHLDCLESKDLILNRKNYQCDYCIVNRQQMGKSLVSKAFK